MTTRRARDIPPWVMMALAVVAIALALSIRARRMHEDKLREGCKNRLTELSFAVLGYRDTHSGLYPPGTASSGGLSPDQRLSWITVLYSFFDESQNVNFLFDRSLPWNSPVNRVPTIRGFRDEAGRNPSYSDWVPPRLLPYHVLVCPANVKGADSGVTNFVGIAGIGSDSPTLPTGHPRAGVFGFDRQTSVADIKDGLASTMMLAETADGIGPWIAGGETTVRGLDLDRRPYIGRGRQFGGLHPGGAMIAFADGSVRFLRESIDPTVFEALSTAAGGEAVPNGLGP